MDSYILTVCNVLYIYSISKLKPLPLCIFLAFFHVASLSSTRVDNEKVGADNEKALKLTNSTVFHRVVDKGSLNSI